MRPNKALAIFEKSRIDLKRRININIAANRSTLGLVKLLAATDEGMRAIKREASWSNSEFICPYDVSPQDYHNLSFIPAAHSSPSAKEHV